jgi:hypothetical protein
MLRFRSTFLLVLFALAILLVRGPAPEAVRAENPKSADPAAVERARENVKMLDDLYKTAVVVVTSKYVEKQADTPAAEVAKEVFSAMHKKGWHHARLVDATGKPKNRENVAKSEFEKKGVDAVKAGKAYLEELGEKDGKPVFRAATVVPAVMKQCTICHGGKEGRVLGAIIYEVPVK